MTDTELLNWIERNPDRLLCTVNQVINGFTFQYRIGPGPFYKWSESYRSIRECVGAAIAEGSGR